MCSQEHIQAHMHAPTHARNGACLHAHNHTQQCMHACAWPHALEPCHKYLCTLRCTSTHIYTHSHKHICPITQHAGPHILATIVDSQLNFSIPQSGPAMGVRLFSYLFQDGMIGGKRSMPTDACSSSQPISASERVEVALLQEPVQTPLLVTKL